VLVPVCWGRGCDAPPASTDDAHAHSASFWGKGLLVPVSWGRGSDAPPASLRGGGGNLLKGGFIHSLHQFALQFFSANYMNFPKSRVGGYQPPNGAGEGVDTTVLSRHLILF